MKTIARRHLIRSLTGAALLPFTRGHSAVRPGRSALIIGAGVSGLAAARDLKAAGVAVTVLEARSRIGGRVHTDRTTFGVPIELGAQFIHGTGAQPVYQLALQNKWAMRPFSANTGQLYRYGVPATDAEETAIWDRYQAFEDWMIDVYKPTLRGNTAVPIEQAVVTWASAMKLTAQQAYEFRATLADSIEGEYGGDTTQISVATYDEDSEFAGSDQILTGGYDQLPALLARGLDIRTGCIVQSIDYRARPVKVVTNQGTFTADYVLVTVPLGVLKANTMAFLPALPVAKQTAIRRMGMGTLDKVILQFPTRFWPVGNWHLNQENADPWGVTFSSLETPFPNSNTLVAWQFGQLAVQRESLSDAALVEVVMGTLRRAFPGKVIPAPRARAITRWARDPHSRGSYSFPAVNSPRSDIDALAAPIASTIFFGGEATNKAYPGTVHGAYLSGQAQARGIIAAASV